MHLEQTPHHWIKPLAPVFVFQKLRFEFRCIKQTKLLLSLKIHSGFIEVWFARLTIQPIKKMQLDGLKYIQKKL